MFVIFLTMAAAFALELVLCMKAEQVMVKLIPVFMDMFAMLVCSVLFIGKLLPGTYWGFTGETILAAAFMWAAMVLAAMLVAWPVYWAVERIRSKNEMPLED